MNESSTELRSARIVAAVSGGSDPWQGLENACVELAGLIDPASSQIDVQACLEWLASRVHARQRGGQPEARLAHLHQVFFAEECFRGNLESYYLIENQLITSVLSRRQGLPVMLSLVYKRVADRLGLAVDGLNLPGHFLVRVRDSCGWLVVDPFCEGRVMTAEEAWQRLGEATGWERERLQARWEPITPLAWLRRCIASLLTGLERAGEYEKEDAVREVLQQLPVDEPRPRR